MYLPRKTKLFGKNPEGGFVLLAALMGVMILLAVGFFALTVSTGDINIASHMVGERKAFSAAESGVHALCQNFTPTNTGGVSNTYIDSANDPTVRYSYTTPVINDDLPAIAPVGYELTKSYQSAVYNTVVTGEDTAYSSKTEIAVGTATAPNPSDTQQGYN